MKLQDLYTDWRVAAGIALACLGAGNWIIGLNRTQQYSQIIASSPNVAAGSDYRSFDELDASAGGAVLEPLTARERAVSYATARMDFYHATFLTGQMLVLAALLVIFWGVIAVIQNDTRRALRLAALAGNAPPGGSIHSPR
ncbi:MAG TPA: hypothetical protein VNF29_15080 [Candidatus Binataceae bacterium]|nr:hypothetical protein [Candidatus Binataceae bacterium]